MRDRLVLKSAVLAKRGRLLRAWKRRRFDVLSSGELRSGPAADEPGQAAKLAAQLTANAVVQETAEPSTFRVRDVEGRELLLRAADAEEARDWIECLCDLRRQLDRPPSPAPPSAPTPAPAPAPAPARKKQRQKPSAAALARMPRNLQPVGQTVRGCSGWYRSPDARDLLYVVDAASGEWTLAEERRPVVKRDVARACDGTIQGETGWYDYGGRFVFCVHRPDGQWELPPLPPPDVLPACAGTTPGETGWYRVREGLSLYCRRQADGSWTPVGPPWDCPRCTLANGAALVLCAACGAERPLAESWVCARCTLRNEGGREECLACCAPPGPSAGVDPAEGAAETKAESDDESEGVPESKSDPEDSDCEEGLIDGRYAS